MRALARSTESTAPTVSSRVKRLMDLGAIQGFSVNLAPWVGLDPAARPPGPTSELRCHQCHGQLPDRPVEERIQGRHHIFCCTLCRDAMVQRAQKFND